MRIARIEMNVMAPLAGRTTPAPAPTAQAPAYDRFGATYQDWTESDSPYRAIELYSFLTAVGDVDGLRVLDLATGEGRIARLLARRGAAALLGTDLSPEMVRRAQAQQDTDGIGTDRLRFAVLDATDPHFALPVQVDLVTAMYLLPYAATEAALQAMFALAERNLRPGGRLVAYTASPDYDFRRPDPRLRSHCGFDYRAAEGNRVELVIAGQHVDVWQWDRDTHARALEAAGLSELRWHPLRCPPQRPGLAAEMAFYLSDPSCIVLSACKPD
ncbi:class I SAM-dependent DNA methyltransferase [Marinibaculum pumilum]|uniref:Class I SAM-dependent DNA methyltransferase n=1 Tax=Marinibaculum pumilum TaxID=1766165 RepID=A0ABV7L8I6_9PROT